MGFWFFKLGDFTFLTSFVDTLYGYICICVHEVIERQSTQFRKSIVSGFIDSRLFRNILNK